MNYRILLDKKISILQVIIGSILLSSLIYFSLRLSFENKITNEGSNNGLSDEHLNNLRNTKDYKYARPLLSVDIGRESAVMNPMKLQLQDLINERCETGNLFQASVFIRNMQTGEWATINKDVLYHPGSLSKVPVLIYYLKASEHNPALLDKKLILDETLVGVPDQTFPSYTIEMNKPYTVRELLKYMVTYSDNNAAILLNKNADTSGVKKVFTDLGLKEPDMHNRNFETTVKDYSLFMRVLYSATYLTPENSDFALMLLSESPFNQGLSKPLPSDLPIAHKFGESQGDDKLEMHESGIIYCKKSPYLVTVMTKGYNVVNQTKIISQMSEIIYHFLCS